MNRKGFSIGKMVWFILPALLLGTMFCGFGCAEETQLSAGGATSAIEAMEPITLRVAEVSPETGARTESLKWMCDEITKRTNGKVNFEIYWSQSLLKATEVLHGVMMGSADVGGFVSPAYNPVELELWAVFGHHWSGGPSITELGAKWWQIYDEVPGLRAELEQWNQRVFGFYVYPGMCLGSKKPVYKLEDIKGLRVRVYGALNPVAFKAVGAETAFMSVPDVYPSLQKGSLDGIHTPIDTYGRYSLYEVTDYLVKLGWENYGVGIASINLDVWNKLPPEVQQIIEDVAREMTDRLAGMVDADVQSVYKKCDEAGVTIVDFPKEDMARWETLPEIKQWVNEYIKDLEAKGKPALVTLNRIEKIMGVYITKLED